MLPGLKVLSRYQRGWWRPDLMAGLTVGAMLIPQSMAYAELAGMPAEYGFYAVLGPLVVYALVGTSRHLGVGPEPGTAILAATGVGAIAAGDPERYVVLMAALALVVAGVCVAGAAARLGFIASVLSKPVLVGYITGVGLTLVSSQIGAFTGVNISSGDFLARFAELFREFSDIDPATHGGGEHPCSRARPAPLGADGARSTRGRRRGDACRAADLPRQPDRCRRRRHPRGAPDVRAA